MKKTVIALFLTVAVSFCYAQNTKMIENTLKQFDKSTQLLADPVKGKSPDVLISHANLLVDMNGLYTNGLYQEMDMAFTPNLIGRPNGPSEEVKFGEQVYKKYPFEKFDVYTIDELVVFWVNKVEAHPGALQEAFDLLKKAKDLAQNQFVGAGKGAVAVDRLKSEYQTDAMSNYRQQKFDEAGAMFAKSVEVAELTGTFDTLACFYSGLCYASAEKYDAAEPVLKKVYESGYANGGDLECLLAEVYTQLEKPEEAIAILEKAVTKFPSNSDILFKSINAFLKAKKDPKQIVETIHLAQKTDSNNVSLYLVEANLHKQLGDTTAYMDCLNKVIAIDPTNCDPYFEYADHEIEIANQIYHEAEKLPLNDTKGFEAKQQERYVHLEKAAVYYEKTLVKFSEDSDVIGTLRQIYYQLRAKDDAAIEEKYNFYNNKYKELTEKAEAEPQK